MTSRAGARSTRSHYDVTLIVTSFATELATPTVTDGRTYVHYGHLTAFNIQRRFSLNFSSGENFVKFYSRAVSRTL